MCLIGLASWPLSPLTQEKGAMQIQMQAQVQVQIHCRCKPK